MAGKRSLKNNLTSFIPVTIILPSEKLSNIGRFHRRLYCSSFLFYVDLGNTLLRHPLGQQYAEEDRSFRITSRTHLRTDLYNLRVAPSAKVWSLTVPPPVVPNLHRP